LLKVRFTAHFFALHVERFNLMWDAMLYLLLHVCCDVCWETVEEVSNKLVIDGIRLDLRLHSINDSR
jgi:hypothetical protein